MKRTPPPNQGVLRVGITLIEVLVVVAIISILASLVIPAISRSRERVRSATCKSHLRQLGIGFSLHADRSPIEALTTGAFDKLREGCIDTWGWVADQINTGQSVPENLLCPGSPLLGSQKVLEVYGLKTNDGLNALTGSLRSRCTDGVWPS